MRCPYSSLADSQRFEVDHPRHIPLTQPKKKISPTRIPRAPRRCLPAFLTALAPFADAIVALDDASEDATPSLLAAAAAAGRVAAASCKSGRAV